ncbi:unnamed protein product [Protopolystoma xenopodis]|uniref:Uncharacterized protein n=1 Tax=Protopolystoma xenopodis TaxID=117903 RepID=A0A3S5AWU1_9PLAT|nr:unnamed protein product [Protopolystoma xenopodis]
MQLRRLMQFSRLEKTWKLYLHTPEAPIRVPERRVPMLLLILCPQAQAQAEWQAGMGVEMETSAYSRTWNGLEAGLGPMGSSSLEDEDTTPAIRSLEEHRWPKSWPRKWTQIRATTFQPATRDSSIPVGRLSNLKSQADCSEGELRPKLTRFSRAHFLLLDRRLAWWRRRAWK